MPLYLSENLGWIFMTAGLLLLCAVLSCLNFGRRKYAARAFSVDAMTGGLTEAAFHSHFQKALSGRLEQFAMVSVQIENLPQMLKTFGAAECEAANCYLYGILHSQLKGDEFATRTGEGTFCFIIKNRRPDEICARLDRICSAANRFNGDGQDAYYLQLIFGIYLPKDRTEDVKIIQGKAVSARLGGESGKRYHFYDEGSGDNIQWEREMADSMEHALRTSEFVVYYQPKIRVLDQRVAGAEALIRWRHPHKGLLSPDMFMPLAERYRKICRIDRYVFEEVCRTLARWKKQSREICPISINLARADLDHPNFADECYDVCCRHGVEPSWIEFEIKEGILLEDLEKSKSLLERFHALGFRCAVDNFGSDLTSMQILGTLEIDTIKLDGSFFGGSNDNRRGRYIVESILKLATQLHIRTVAERIDKPGQVQYLQQVACDMIQGFYYFKPMPLEKFESEVYIKEGLRYVEVSAANSGGNALKKHTAVGQNVQTAKRIIQFSYLPEEDRVEFSESFSPVLGGRKKFNSAMAMFRTTDIIHENDREDFFRLLERCQREDAWVENTLRFYLSGGRYGWLELHLHRDGGVISGTMINIAEWNNEVNRWKEKATRDALTGLYNREHFEHNAQVQLGQKVYTSAALLFIDVDDFKRVNDTLGHMFGDDVLCYVAKQILGVFRHSDIVARYGGDEFVVFAPSIQRQVLEERLERLCGAFRFPYRNETMEYKVSVTIGAAVYPQDGADYDTLLDHADCALYEAKKRGKDQFVLYEPYMQGDSEDVSE